MEVLGFLVLDGGLDVLFQVLDNLEPLIEASDRAHDSAVRPHHVLQHGAALFPEGGLREGDAFLLACLRNGNLVFQKPAFDDVVYGADGKDHTFQQGVGGKPVRSVDARRGDFAAGVQAVNLGTRPGVDQYASAHVVCGGHHGDPFLRDVDTGVEALRVDIREVALDILRGTAREVDEHVRLAEALHFAVDGAGHDVAGRERVQRVHLVHELFALVVLEDAAKAANRFRNQERLLEARRVETGGVELHELDVLQGRTGACRNRHAVATAVGRANGVLPNAPGSAGRKYRRLCVEVFDNARLLVDNLGAHAALGLAFALAEEVLDVAVLDIVDVLVLVELAQERAHDLLTGEVRRVQDAVVAVPAFEVQVELRLVGGVGGELHAPLDQLADGGRAALGEDVHGFLFAEARARLERVVDVKLELVRLFGDGRDAALRIVGRTIGLCALREDNDRETFFCRVNRRAQARDAGTENQNIVHDLTPIGGFFYPHR